VLRSFRPHRPSLGAISAVTGCLALFFAVGGVGYAKQIVHLVDGSTIKKGTIQADRLSSTAQRALKGNQGPVGNQGAQGPPPATAYSRTRPRFAASAGATPQ
jgi:hypothetical protein